MKIAINFIAACAMLAGAAASFSQNSLLALPTVDAEVRKVDSDAQKLTLRHAEIPNVDMAAMTMVFRVRDPALLQQVKAGDRVRVTVDRIDGALTVMSVEPATATRAP